MADAASGDIRAEILADLDGSAKPVAPVEEAAEVEAEAADDETASQDEAVDGEAVETASDDDTEVEATSDDEDEQADDDEDEVVLKSDDPKEQKLFDNVRRAEKRMREAAARRDAEFQAERAKWQAQVDRVAEMDKLLARVKYDPMSLLRAANVSADDFELIAQAIYAESPALQNDPKQKAAAQAKLREREKEEKYTALEKKQAELEAKIEQTKRDAQAQAEAAAYIQQINTTASSQYPLVAKLLKADPDETNDALVATYNTLGKKLNRAPKPAEVVAAYDKAQRARLQRLGIDPSTLVKPAVKKPANGNAPVAKPAVAKPVNGTAKPVDERAAILAELDALTS